MSVLRRILLLVPFLLPMSSQVLAYDIGVYYYPGWESDYINWKDIKGLPDSRSPGKPWSDREPLIGHYPEEETWVAEKHIEWASQYGINFFAYDWYWDGKQPEYNHALKNYLMAKNKTKLKFCLLWANPYPVPNNLKEFDDMVAYWVDNYFNQPTYYQMEGRPVIFIFDIRQLETNAKKFGESAKTLLTRANIKAKEKGLKGICFVVTVDDRPSDAVEKWLFDIGFNAYTGWNYFQQKGSKIADYDVMVDTYIDYYSAASKTAKQLPYIVPASPGWDSRPWHGNNAVVRSNPTPEKFERMLLGAKKLMDENKDIPKILMIEAWNEFGEGSYIEPTKKWGFRYLETIRKVFKAAGTKQ